jgi:hypothetical protein
MKKAVIGIVDTQAQVETIITRLQAVGFGLNDISVLLPSSEGTKTLAHESHSKAPQGAAAGAGAGGVLGGTLGVLLGIGALVIPGLGPFLAVGPIMAGLSGLGAGAALGGFTGALVGMGIPEFEAKMYEGRLKAGNILIGVHTDDDEERKRALEVYKVAGVRGTATETEKAAPRRRS